MRSNSKKNLKNIKQILFSSTYVDLYSKQKNITNFSIFFAEDVYVF